MKKGLFCAVLVVVSLVTGWCFADFGRYCNTSWDGVPCTGTVNGTLNNADSLQPLVMCELNGNKIYHCEDVWYNPFSFCSSSIQCSGSAPGMNGQSCYNQNSVKGCRP